MSTEFILNQAALSQVVNAASTKLIGKAARLTLADAKQRTPVDTGALRQSHTMGPITHTPSKTTVEISANTTYAMAVHEGSRPHIIRPKNAKVLTWNGPQGRIFARSVHHPGSKGRPWLLNAAQSQAGRLGFTVTEA